MRNAPLHPFRFVALALSIVIVTAAHPSAWGQSAVVGILEGRASLVRQSATFALAEGVGLRDSDIIETAASSFVQIELPDGVRVGIGDNSRLMLGPATHGLDNARLYLLQGWLKITQPGDKPAAGEFVTPRIALANLSGASVILSDATQFAAFVENGGVRLGERAGAQTPLVVKGGDFASSRAGTKLEAVPRPPPEFLDKMPRPFRDPLPARAGRFKDNLLQPRLLGDVSYDGIAAWLQAEPAIRLPLLDRWRGRLKDKAFRAGVITNLARHPEWRPVVFPPPPPKPPVVAQPIAPAGSAAAPPRAP